MPKKPRPFTKPQQSYISAIVAAGQAPLEEVEAAFLDRSGESHDKISAWGSELRRKQKAVYQQHLRSLTRFEPCAYPGCSNTIKVVNVGKIYKESPEPTRWVKLIIQLEGWHYEGWSKVENRKEVVKKLYGCSPEHKEGIYGLEFYIVSFINEEREKQINTIQYPIESSHEAWWKVLDLARRTAQAQVELSSEKDLKHIRRTIEPLAIQSLEHFLAQVADLEHLTDNMDKFRSHYIEQYRDGYLEALRSQKRKAYRRE